VRSPPTCHFFSAIVAAFPAKKFVIDEVAGTSTSAAVFVLPSIFHSNVKVQPQSFSIPVLNETAEYRAIKLTRRGIQFESFRPV
jgi:hypothetical protein